MTSIPNRDKTDPMKLVVLLVIAGLFVFFTLRSSGLGGAGDFPRVSADQARQLLSENKAILVDVREKEEVEAGMLKGALWLPLSGLQAGDAQTLKTLESIESGKEIIAYCRSGNRSARAAALLVEKGYRVRNLGGYEAAKAAGIPSQ